MYSMIFKVFEILIFIPCKYHYVAPFCSYKLVYHVLAVFSIKIHILDEGKTDISAIEYCLDVQYKTKDTEQEELVYNAVNRFFFELEDDLEQRKKYIPELGKIATRLDYQRGQRKEEFEQKIRDGKVPGTESIRHDDNVISVCDY